MPRALNSLLVAGSARAAPQWSILVYGDSLSAAYGIALARGWVALLGERLKRERPDYSVVNASISGETTAGGRTRLKAALERHQPAIVVLELGATDGLRGLPLKQMQENLAAASITLDAAAVASINALEDGSRVGGDPAIAAHSQL